MMKENYIRDSDGKKLIKELDNGLRVEILEKPSPEYIANMTPAIPEIEPRDYLAEIDELKTKITDYESRIAKLEKRGA